MHMKVGWSIKYISLLMPLDRCAWYINLLKLMKIFNSCSH